MSNPFRDHAASKAAKKRERIREEYTPIVIWVKAPGDKSVHEVRKWLRDKAVKLPFVSVATGEEPFWYATDGTDREERVR